MRGFTGQVWVLAVAVLTISAGRADEQPKGPNWPLLECELTEFGRRVFKITDVVLDQHVEPPTRQEMLLCGLTALHPGALPEGLSRAVSKTAAEDDFAECLIRFWPKRSGNGESAQLRQTFLYGMGQAVPGGLDFESAKQSAVNRQIAANQYVGIGIMIGASGNGNRHQIGGTFPRGPAARAGIQPQEYIAEVDGVKTDKLSTEQLVDRLRGPEGTTVTLGVTSDATSEPRLIKLTRSVVPRQTVIGHRQLAPEKWECVLEGERPVGYLNVQEMTASTVSELREYEAELDAKNVGFLVLDVRGAQCSELRYAIAVADALLDGGSGFVRSYGQTMSVPFERDCLFRGWPMAVLVSSYTSGYAEWLACLLQQQRKAIVVGQPTTGADRFVLTRVELPDDWGTMRLATAVLERERRALNKPTRAFDGRSAFFVNVSDSLLYRLSWANRSALDGLHAVSPDAPVEDVDAFKWNPRGPGVVQQSRLVERAVEALTSPGTAKSRNQNSN